MRTTFDKIEKYFGFDIRGFFIEYNSFISSDLPGMISFYKGRRTYPIEVSQKRLSDLIVLARVIDSKIQETQGLLDFVEYYEIVDEFEDCSLKLLTYSNLKKWLKINENKGLYGQKEVLTHTLSRNESLEDSADLLGYTNRDAGSLTLGLQNSVKETDFSLREGGHSLQFNHQDQSLKIQLTSIVDGNLNGERVLGYDLDRKLSLTEDDLTPLTAHATFAQASETSLGLKRGDNPEFPYDGIDKTLLVNQETVSTSFPIIFRQLLSVISKDDTIRNIELRDVSYAEDRINLELDVFSHLSESIVVKTK